MKMNPPTQSVTPLNLTNTNVLEGEVSYPNYNPATAYALDDTVVAGVHGGVLTLYKSLQNGNIGHPPASSPAWWKPYSWTYGEWQDYEYYLKGAIVLDVANHRTYESANGTAATVTISNASPAVVTWVGHGLADNIPIAFETTNSLPTGIVAGQVYFTKGVQADTFKLVPAIGGAEVNTSTAGTGIHTAYANPNKNKPLSNPTYWINRGPSNRFAMFDTSPGSQTRNLESIIILFSFPERIDRLCFFNVSAARIKVTIGSPSADGPILDETYSMSDTAGITDPYRYFFEPVVRKRDLIIRDIPPYDNPTVFVQIDEPGGTAAVGALLAGRSFDLGGTMWGVELGSKDYSKYIEDEWGNLVLVPRANAKRNRLQLSVPNRRLDAVKTTLDDHLGQVVVWEGTDDYAGTWILGYCSSHDAILANAKFTTYALQIQGVA